jgi:hypothetical protein
LYFDIADVVFGDLTGDGKDEAAVVAIYGSNLGSFLLTDTYVFGCVGGKVKLIDILKQSRIEKESEMLVHESIKKPVTIRNGILSVAYGTEGARPSPEFTTTFRYKVLGGNLEAKMKETNAALAGEMSGHIFFADRFYGFDDATYAGARVLEILSNTDQPLSQLLSDLPETFSTPELRVDCADERKFEIVRKIAEEFAQTNEVITIDGARILFENGWGLVRASNTQAILVLRFEADSDENLKAIRETVESRVNHFIG